MVLEEAAAPTDAFLSSNDYPQSDPDPYENSNTSSSRAPGTWMRIEQNGIDNKTAAPVFLNLNDLPRRFTLLNAGPHPDFVIKGIQQQCFFVANTLQRPITQPEADALAFHFAKSIRMASYGAPVGAAIAGALAYRGRKTYRFPGWSPFKEGSKLSRESFGPFKGMQAKIAWHGTRIFAYSMVGMVLGQIFFGSYALSVSLAGRAMDPRLKDFNETLRERQKSGLGREAGRRVEDESPGAKGMETYDMARQRRAVQGGGRKGKEEQRGWDDASPTGAASFDQEVVYGAEQSGFMSEQEVRRQVDARMNANQTASSSPTEASQSVTPQSSRTSRGAATSSSSPQQTSSGGSWDKLRQEAMSANPPKASSSSPPFTRGMSSSNSAGTRALTGGREDASSGDGFGFPSDEPGRRSTQSEAQKEFNARMERERAGGDFNAGSEGEGRRGWS
ncbi:hypothetical protein LTR62_005944 [Meristemomyces frigidus]|uniref:Uncharacterized protein n=1 Tax=Meristemomyces frigidus TaxID=1508187 RepID=A0AAN7TMY7_9PEZI|nr:hypothetical protein LTR62_005944 [Meristemomyces frigidus]